VNPRWKTLDEIYKINILLHCQTSKFQQNFVDLFCYFKIELKKHFSQKLQRFAILCLILMKSCRRNFATIFRNHMEEIMEIIFRILFCQIYEIFAKFPNANQSFIIQFIISFASLAAILCVLRANQLSPTTFFHDPLSENGRIGEAN